MAKGVSIKNYASRRGHLEKAILKKIDKMLISVIFNKRFSYFTKPEADLKSTNTAVRM